MAQNSPLTRTFAPLRRAAVPCAVALAVILGGCAALEDMFRQKPQALLPAGDMYQAGEQDMNKKSYPAARANFQKIVERHPNSSFAPRARFLIGETYYREATFDKAIKEFESFMLVREYPDSRYASDALAKIDICRGRLAQKELWVAAYYLENENNPVAARQRLEGVIKDYPRSLVMPEALYRLADINAREGRTDEAQQMFRRCANEYPYTEWGRRAGQRLRTAASN